MHTRTAWLVLSLSAILAAPASAQLTPGTEPGTFKGPSSSQTPYVIPTAPGWSTIAVISVGDQSSHNSYRMVGIPDGLGAIAGRFRNGRYVDEKKYMTVLMNHEIPGALGVTRDHGQTGAFVSQWTIRLDSLSVRRGEDLIQNVYAWDTLTSQYILANGSLAGQLNRLCSADLPAESAFYNSRTHKGFDGRLFMNGEESGVEGRAFAHVATGDGKGNSYELPHLGRFSWENSVAHPNSGDKTIVVALDDTSPGGEVYVYVGNKRRSGNPAERAGLHGGTLYGITVNNGGANYANAAVVQENAGPISGTFELKPVTDPAYVGSGAVLQTFSTANGFTKFVRPEDGAWDTQDPRVFYFVVTGGQLGQSARLYRLKFNFDWAGNPTGGTITLIVDRAALMPPSPPNTAQFDNITVAEDGAVLVQEDPGNSAYIARTWSVNPATKVATEILQSDPARFAPPVMPPFTQDEESSGIVEVTDIVRHAKWADKSRRYFLADMQAHYPNGPELVEGGQLYLVASPRVRHGNGDHKDHDDGDRGDHHEHGRGDHDDHDNDD